MDKGKYREDTLHLIEQLSGQKNILTIPVMFIKYIGYLRGVEKEVRKAVAGAGKKSMKQKLTKGKVKKRGPYKAKADIDPALFLSQCLYWTDRTEDPEGWFFKSYPEWEEEIYLSKHEVMNAVKLLKKHKVLETKVRRAKGSPTVHYRIAKRQFSLSIVEYFDYALFNNSTMQTPIIQLSSTETTADNTTDIKTEKKKRNLVLEGNNYKIRKQLLFEGFKYDTRKKEWKLRDISPEYEEHYINKCKIGSWSGTIYRVENYK